MAKKSSSKTKNSKGGKNSKDEESLCTNPAEDLKVREKHENGVDSNWSGYDSGVEAKQNEDDEEKEEGGGIWDIVTVIKKGTAENKDSKLKCRMEGCRRKPVAIWAEDTNPADTWPMCEKCQESEFGGWPQGLNGDDDDVAGGGGDVDDSETTTKKDTEGNTPEDEKNDIIKEDANATDIDMTTTVEVDEVNKKEENNTISQEVDTPGSNEESSNDGNENNEETDFLEADGEMSFKEMESIDIEDAKSIGSSTNDPPSLQNEETNEETNEVLSDTEILDVAEEQTDEAIVSDSEVGNCGKVAREESSEVKSTPSPNVQPKLEEGNTSLESKDHDSGGKLEESEKNDKGNEPVPLDEKPEEQDCPQEEKLVPESPRELGSQDEISEGHSAEMHDETGQNIQVLTKETVQNIQVLTEEEAKADEDEEGASDGNEQPESWIMIKITSIKDLSKSRPVKCSQKGCKLPAACVYVSSLDPKEKWNYCLDCQVKDFDGWPDDLSELPLKHMTEEHLDMLASKCSTSKDIAMPVFSSNSDQTLDVKKDHPGISEQSPDEGAGEMKDNIENTEHMEVANEYDDGDEKEEAWDMVKIMSMKDLMNECPIKCSTETCTLPAACAYVSNLAPKGKWYTCLDCQLNDYGGWPDDLSELPLQYMTHEHLKLLANKCSRSKDIVMPVFPASPTKENSYNNSASHTTITPPPGTVSQNHTQNGGAAKKNTITPSPACGLVAEKQVGSKAPNKQALAIHRKWQEAAEANGGPCARIVVSKPEAKKLIFDILHDSFRPMNITQIYQALKATIPSPVLKFCLDDMALGDIETNFADSDDEEDSGPKKKKERKENCTDDPYHASLCIKALKTPLYYVDHTKLKNNGNGLDPADRNELASKLSQAESEELALKAKLKQMTDETNKLLSEPTNEEATERLEREESSLADLKAEVEASRKLKVNEKHKSNLKKRITKMIAEWRKRRRICMDFLTAFEDNTDGIISRKKCLAGDGPIDIDSDEVAFKNAKEYAKKKRTFGSLGKRPLVSNKKRKIVNGDDTIGVAPSSNFIAVVLDSQGCVKRLYSDED